MSSCVFVWQKPKLDISRKKMALEERGGWREVEKLCEDEELMAAVGDRSIFSLDDINLDDIFLDIKDSDISGFVPDSPHPAPPASAGLHVSSATASSGEAVDASAVLPEGLLCDDVDVTQLEWLSNFCEESYSSSDGLPFVPCKAAGGLPFHVAGGSNDGVSKKASNPTAEVSESMDQELIFRSTSPISVLEQCISFSAAAGSYSSSLSSPTSSSGSGNMTTATPRSPPEPVVIPARSRSKRPRPPSFSVRHPIVVPPSPPDNTHSVAAAAPADCAALYCVGSEPEEAESDCPEENREEEEEEEEKKKRKKKPKKKAQSSEGEEEEEAASSGARKCMHCEVTKTPQWRAGPMGPKTLCNACGVRYKSGRLFPEYRPAASPTFVPTIHSNSHKKVVEIRNKVGQDAPDSDPSPRPLDVVAKSCELLEYLRRKECRAVDRPGILSG